MSQIDSDIKIQVILSKYHSVTHHLKTSNDNQMEGFRWNPNEQIFEKYYTKSLFNQNTTVSYSSLFLGNKQMWS